MYNFADRRGGVVQPHIYPHPLTKKLTLCFHLGMTDHYVIDAGSPEVCILFYFLFFFKYGRFLLRFKILSTQDHIRIRHQWTFAPLQASLSVFS